MIHHVCIALLALCLLSQYNLGSPLAYLVSLLYLYLVHERYVMRLRKKLEFEGKKHSSRRRVLTDSETVLWLNHAVEKIWPVCLEQIVSQNLLLPVTHWFLAKYRPWTMKKAEVQSLYLGTKPPFFTDMRVVRRSTDEDHIVLQLGLNFLTAGMSSIFAVKLRRRLGFGISAKLHVTGMHLEGKLLVGVKFVDRWPFVGRIRLCFAEPPHFQMVVRPLSASGLDVSGLPGIAGWLDKFLSTAFEQTLIEPNMLVVDLEKLAASESGGSPQQESWLSVDTKEAVAYAKIEVIEGSDMKPSDLNGLADPYVKGQLGPYKFRTKTIRKTLAPSWHEEFRVPITTWEATNVLNLEVLDKDHFIDDQLGKCCVNINSLKDGQRHDMWLPLQNINMGRLHLRITVVEEVQKGHVCSSTGVENNLEALHNEGQRETAVWNDNPGSGTPQTWEPQRGKNRHLDTNIEKEPGCFCSRVETAEDLEKTDRISKRVRFLRGLIKIRLVCQRSVEAEDHPNVVG